jgi:hypothetical protein
VSLIKDNIAKINSDNAIVSSVASSISQAATRALENSSLNRASRLSVIEKEEFNNSIKKRLFLKYLSIDYGRNNAKDMRFRSESS